MAHMRGTPNLATRACCPFDAAFFLFAFIREVRGEGQLWGVPMFNITEGQYALITEYTLRIPH